MISKQHTIGLNALLEDVQRSYKMLPADGMSIKVRLTISYGHSVEKQSLNYLCIQNCEIEELYKLEL